IFMAAVSCFSATTILPHSRLSSVPRTLPHSTRFARTRYLQFASVCKIPTSSASSLAEPSEGLSGGTGFSSSPTTSVTTRLVLARFILRILLYGYNHLAQQPAKGHLVGLRLDYTFSPKHTFFLRGNIDANNAISGSATARLESTWTASDNFAYQTQ